jgi:hypothetical protein
MTMLRLGSMNLMLHGLTAPRFHYADTLSKGFTEEHAYDVVLANPPFKGAVDSSDVNPSLPTKVKKTEILFVHLFLRLLENGGRAAVIVPDGVLFGSTNAHVLFLGAENCCLLEEGWTDVPDHRLALDPASLGSSRFQARREPAITREDGS